MSRLAIFIDGGHLSKTTASTRTRIDFHKFAQHIHRIVASESAPGLELFRTYYYDCLPYQSNPPTSDESSRVENKKRFFRSLEAIPKFQVREGFLQKIDRDDNGNPLPNPVFRQKVVDLKLGVDLVHLSLTRQITHAVLVAGDSDFLPAIEIAKQNAVSFWVFYGQNPHRDLLQIADERHPIDVAFLDQVRRP